MVHVEAQQSLHLLKPGANVQNPALETLLQTMRDAIEKLERAVQLPSRKDFESMTERVDELSRRIASLEKKKSSKPKKK